MRTQFEDIKTTIIEKYSGLINRDMESIQSLQITKGQPTFRLHLTLQISKEQNMTKNLQN